MSGLISRLSRQGNPWVAAVAALLFLTAAMGRPEAGALEELAAAKDALASGRYGVAYKTYRQLADLDGNPQAQYHLGIMARDGLGAPKAPLDALNWFEHAAVQGHAPAYYATGQLYFLAPPNPATGNQFPQDVAKAYLWLSAAEKRTADREEREVSEKLRQVLIGKLPVTWLPELDSLVEKHLSEIGGS